jgi:hypothetical protein
MRVNLRWIVTASIIGAVSIAAWSAPEPRSDVKSLGAGGSCGVERWGVKTLTDAAALKVNMKPNNSTVEQLTALPVPSGFHANAGRLTPEFQTYTVKARLVEFKEENDSDIHLVISGASGRTMIAEIPDARCAIGSRVQRQIDYVRTGFAARFGQPRRQWQTVNQTVFLTGVLFFDVPHHQTGVAPNAVELHPVLALK